MSIAVIARQFARNDNFSFIPLENRELSTKLKVILNWEANVEVRKDIRESVPEIFGDQMVNGKKLNAEDLIAKLTDTFFPTFEFLLKNRSALIQKIAQGEASYGWAKPDLPIEDADGNKLTVQQIRQGLLEQKWKCNATVPVPSVCHKPGLQGTGPADDMGMLMSAINTGSASWMFDWEDAGNDYEDKLYQAWRNLRQVLRGEWTNKTYTHPLKKKDYAIKLERKNWGSLFHRLPGLHLINRQMTHHGRPVPAMIAAIVIHTLNNFDALKNNQGVLFYVPKIETPEEAKLVASLIKAMEEEIGVKRGTLKIEMLHERAHFTANQELIMWVLRENLIGANVGRWDYINSLIEMNKDSGETYMDPHRFGMTAPQLTAYTRRNALLTYLAGGFPIGGMSALMKNSTATDTENNKAINDIWFDKLRERLTGLFIINGKMVDAYRQSWVATTETSYVKAGAEALVSDLEKIGELVNRASEDQKATLRKLGLINETNEITPLEIKASDLTVDKLWSERAWNDIAGIAKGDITEDGLRYAIYMASEYMFQQLNGNNAAAINIREGDDNAIRLMNDFATYEIFWHWLWTAYHNKAVLTTDGKTTIKGERVTWKLLKRFLDERTQAVKKYFDTHPVKAGTASAAWNRDLAWVVMDVLERQLKTQRWITYGSRVLLSLIEKTADERAQVLSAIFSSSREEAFAQMAKRQLAQKALAAHDYVYDSPLNLEDKVREVESEWQAQAADGRRIKRLHTARQTAELRLRQNERPAYRVQNAMAQKMYQILRRHQRAGTSVKTIGFADEFSMEAAARAGIELSYNGGWLESCRAGTSDQARYPYSFLAETISRYSRHLQQHARHNPELADKFLIPMFVDIDTGHMAPKEMVEYIMTFGTDAPLIGAVHIEDQAHGAKKCGHMAGKVLTSTEEHIKRLNNVRLQLDIMGLDTLVVARTDSEAAEFINSIHDERDHPFLLGATNPDVEPYHSAITEARKKEMSEESIAKLHKTWKESAKIRTLKDAVAAVLKTGQEEWALFAQTASIKDAKTKARVWGVNVWSSSEWKLLKSLNQFPKDGDNIMWDPDLPSTEESGYMLFMVQSGIEMAMARSKAFLPYADISWMEQHHPDLKQSRRWAETLLAHAKALGLSEPLLANNTSPSFYWRAKHEGHSLTDKELETFLDEQGKFFQFQFITYGGSELDHRNTERFLKDPEGFIAKGMLAWANFQDEALAAGNAFLQNSQGFAGVVWNEKKDVAGNGARLVASATGDKDTMAQFGKL